jgi:hypothetical protein
MRWIFAALIVAGVTSPGSVRAQMEPHTHAFSPLAQVTVNGTVELVRAEGLDGCELCDACGDCRAVHIVVRTRSSHTDVHLAPAWYLARLEFAPSPGDIVRVIGSRARLPKGRGLSAHEVHIGSVGLKLRDEHGLPLWRRMLTDARPSSHDTIGR